MRFAAHREGSCRGSEPRPVPRACPSSSPFRAVDIRRPSSPVMLAFAPFGTIPLGGEGGRGDAQAANVASTRSASADSSSLRRRLSKSAIDRRFRYASSTTSTLEGRPQHESSPRRAAAFCCRCCISARERSCAGSMSRLFAESAVISSAADGAVVFRGLRLAGECLPRLVRGGRPDLAESGRAVLIVRGRSPIAKLR